MMILDNHELVRRGLAALIDAEQDMVACGAVACTSAALEEIARVRPDVVLMDVSGARSGGLKLLQRITQVSSGTRIVALAMNERPDLVSSVLRAGADAFVLKSGRAAGVLEAIRRSQSDREIPQGRRDPRSGLHVREARELDALGPTEREIVHLIGRGISAREIAVSLGLSVARVEAHRRRIRAKLNCRTAAELVQRCVRFAEEAANASAGN